MAAHGAIEGARKIAKPPLQRANTVLWISSTLSFLEGADSYTKAKG
jgi:hypothetical protein